MSKGKTRAALALRDGTNCFYCSVRLSFPKRSKKRQDQPTDATIDHIIPKAHGGSSGRHNIVLACFACNNERGDKDAAEFLRTKRIRQAA
jgi:5-methylcytosine-specific restriction endonuclease McrA